MRKDLAEKLWVERNCAYKGIVCCKF